MDTGAWLHDLGLGQYEAAFRDNALDFDLLPGLTADDLKEIGVVALGHRKRLLDAIAKLGKAERPKPSPLPSSRDDAERRPITVMFCDLVGSTSLAAKLDAEDWRELVSAYLDEASKAVVQFGGHVLKKLGDGLMALFGYPQAQENDAERAARAGLAILRALDDLNARNVARGLPALAARIGLETGPVVVDATGEVFGDAPNVAARVQSAAEPGTLFVTEAVQRQVAGQFVAKDKGPHELKGVPGRPTLYRLVRASGGGRRGGARSLTPLVGREEELATLERRWERAKAGDGQFVQIVGEPGLGKSRLTEELRVRLAAAPHTWVAWSSSQLLQNTPLHPISEWGRQRFGGAEIAADKRLAELEAALAQVKLDPAEHAPLLAPLLDIPLPEGRAPKLAPEELRRRQLAATVAWLLAGARQQPIVLAFEDLHWADPTTLDLMKTLAERGAQAQLLIVATTRPEFRASWATRSHHSVISLSPLDRAEIIKMVAAIAERHALSKEAVEGVSNRTGGVPLFVEEVTRLLLEGGGQTIPPTLQQSLAARLDRLGDARELAQIGAVLGREFSYPLLRAVSGWSGPAQDAALEKLAEADLLFVEGAAPASTYRFKHALIQDAAYESLLKTRRQALHRRAAEALTAASDPQPELVAHHFTQSNQTELAIEWWGKAGDAALKRSAFREAIAHLGKAIEMSNAGEADVRPVQAPDAASVAQGKERRNRDNRAKYAQAVMITEGFTSDATRVAYMRIDGSSRPGQTSERWNVLYAQWIQSLRRGDNIEALATAQTQLSEADAARIPGMAASALRQMSWCCHNLGRFAEARSHAQRARALYDPSWDAEGRVATGVDFLAASECVLANAIWPTGDVDAAHTHLEAAILRAEETDPAYTLITVLANLAYLMALERRPEETLRLADRALAVGAERSIGAWDASNRFYQSWAYGRLRDPRTGIADLRAAWNDIRQGRSGLFDYSAPALLADLQAAAGATDDALATIADGLRLYVDTGHRRDMANLFKLRGNLLAESDPAAAEASYREAINVAREQGGRTFELLAALPLARMLISARRPLDARDVLAPALEGFAPTPELPAIAEAQALLAELEADDLVRSALARREARLKLQTGYAQALMWSKGYAADETRAALERARELAGTTSDVLETISVYQGRWARHQIRAEFQDALRLAEEYLRKAESSGRSDGADMARRHLGNTLFSLGQFVEAKAVLLKVVERGPRNVELMQTGPSDLDDQIIAMLTLARPCWLLGEIERAVALAKNAVALAKATGKTTTHAHAQLYDTLFNYQRGDAVATLNSATVLRDLGLTLGMRYHVAVSDVALSWASGHLREPAEGASALREALNRFVADHNRIGLPEYFGLLAELEVRASELDCALASVDRGLSIATETGEHWSDSCLHRLRGDIPLKRDLPDLTSAEEAYREAIRVSREQGARTLELLAALPLARLLQTSNRPLEAHDVLAPVLEGFKPTPELLAIADAQALLAKLPE